MDTHSTLFQHQALLERIAQRIVGSAEDAKDVVQDTFVKWLHTDHTPIQNHKAYLIRSVKNNALNYLEALSRKKEEVMADMDIVQKVDAWYKDSEWSKLELEDELDAALMVLQAKLEPLERAVFLMREVFNFDYDTIQEAVEKRKDHLRQLVSRAKKKLAKEDKKPLFTIKMEQPESLRQFFDSLDLGSFHEIRHKLLGDN
jgi:RNA polymerase sigma-70 factor (ECF subfamily)